MSVVIKTESVDLSLAGAQLHHPNIKPQDPDHIASIHIAFQALTNLETVFLNLKSLNKSRRDVWRGQFKSLKEFRLSPSEIMIYGATGSGKSTLINAMLEDELLPTSGVNACTSVPIKVSWHRKSTPTAVVSFITETMWKHELDLLLADLRDDSNTMTSTADFDQDSVERVAWDKLKAVYPCMTSWSLAEMKAMSVDDIIALDPGVMKLLRTRSKNITATSSPKFVEKLEKYCVPRASSVQAFWPLVKQISINCCAHLLSTGAVLVDLPGVADENAARVKVAEESIKNAAYMWVVTTTERAYATHTMRDIMDRMIHRQLNYAKNHKPNFLTCIATKTDNLPSPKEIIGNLNLREDPYVLCLENLLDQSTTGHKRPLPNNRELNLSEKRAKRSDNDYTTIHKQGIISNTRTQAENVMDLETLSKEEVQRLLKRYCSQKRSEHICRELKNKFRNEYVDQIEFLTDDAWGALSDAMKASPPDLSVFACSASDFRKITAPSIEDGEPECFCDEDDTGIPALQKHCRQLASESRRETIEMFLDSIGDVARSLLNYLQNSGEGSKDDRAILRSRWESEWRARVKPESSQAEPVGPDIHQRLEQIFRELKQTTMDGLTKAFGDRLKPQFTFAAEVAADSAKDVVLTLTGYNPAGGSRTIRWNTFNAIVRRQGVWRGYNLNEGLLAPFIERIVKRWSTVFSADLFSTLKNDTLSSITTLAADILASTAQTQSLKPAVEKQKDILLKEADKSLGALLKAMRKILNSEQQEVTRLLLPQVIDEMQPAYSEMASYTGRGSLRRRIEYLVEFIESHGLDIFKRCSDLLCEKLDAVVVTMARVLQENSDRLAKNLAQIMVVAWTPRGEDDRAARDEQSNKIMGILHELEQAKTSLDTGENDDNSDDEDMENDDDKDDDK